MPIGRFDDLISDDLGYAFKMKFQESFLWKVLALVCGADKMDTSNNGQFRSALGLQHACNVRSVDDVSVPATTRTSSPRGALASALAAAVFALSRSTLV